MAEALRVGLLGYGLAGRVFHAPLIAATPGLRLDAIVTRDPQRREQARQHFPDARLVDDADEFWRTPDALDLVVVATPNRLHVPMARAALAAGLPVVVDKPLAATAAEGRTLVDEATERGVPLTVFQNRRWDGDFLTARRLVEQGELGRVLRFESRFERFRPTIKPGWRELASPEEAGGALFDLGAHLVDQAVQLFGRVDRVYAEVDRRRAGAAVDDDAFVALTHANGVHSHLWMGAVTAQLGPRLRVLGDRAGYTTYGLDVQEAALHDGGRPDQPGWGEVPPERYGKLGVDGDLRPVPTEPGAYQSFYAQVATALRDGAPMPVDPRDSVATVELIELAHRSAVEGAVLPVPTV
ncbi:MULTISPECIES: Gfo/Idh/MocA family oxidoreductase [Micromonospora]|uniref:Gfo/Idh/MocA family oxidoreductase n=1 Tax=Micromonospora zamorensis TaxID=709883 RepID=A0ABZ1P6M5_9ACTN|nr:MULTISPECIES: Gfo/Idh/MocA family oxidoreductase [Micromonospora]MBQ0978775.1 Gfo/Idh/MocA family oxidoreductase [Micromonospora sp. M61]MBQ1038543.1 Gfo/Idh/MocA family oxidoreductase [Micromonospora sp. C81]WSK47604.1 Gfo/Idh/MocA family oxidoreductase [Micromonospora zamorensis]WTE89693.1 Gfo/Idh/MocA family oxidoreductase [Micromonospora zamorensis]WTI24473.1 Gfo/Idh/MocA family oxidoreductase [Micromonospora zamorensis]